MDTEILNYIVLIVFFVITGFFAIVSLLATYIFIRYGRRRSFTILTSLIFAGLFVLSTISSLVFIQQIF